MKKRDFPKVVEATGYIPSHKQVKKGYMLTPHFLSFSFTCYTLAKNKNNIWMVGRCPGSSPNATEFDLESI